MARKSLADALGGDEPDEPKPADPPFAAELQHAPRQPGEPQGVAPDPETYKLTVILEQEQYEALEHLVEVVLAEVQPRRVGKGWRTRVIRTVLDMVNDSPSLQFQVAERLKWAEENIARDDPRRRRRR